jgi:hypothetical protein
MEHSVVEDRRSTQKRRERNVTITKPRGSSETPADGRAQSDTESSEYDAETLAARVARVFALVQAANVTLFRDDTKQVPLVWTADGQSIDPRQTPNYGPQLTFPDGGSPEDLLNSLSCFFLMHEVEMLAKGVTAKGRDMSDDYRSWTVTPGDYYVMLGIFVYFGCYPEQSRDAYKGT